MVSKSKSKAEVQGLQEAEASEGGVGMKRKTKGKRGEKGNGMY